MKTSLSKKEIRSNLETALISEIEKMEGTGSSKKIRRVVRRISKDIAIRVKLDIKKRLRKDKRIFNSDTENDVNGYLIEAEKIENGHA